MSAPSPEPNYRAMMMRQDTDARSHLGDPLISINPKNIDAQTRVPNVFSMATLAMMAKWTNKEPKTDYPERGKDNQFNTKTLAGIMDTWEYEYKKKAISLDGKSREEYVKVASFVAVGQGDETGVLTQSLLNEGSKNLGQGKATKTK
jgi:hypothetical protein